VVGIDDVDNVNVGFGLDDTESDSIDEELVDIEGNNVSVLIGVSDIWDDKVTVFDCSEDEERLINDDGDKVVFAVVVLEFEEDLLGLDECVLVLEFEEDLLGLDECVLVLEFEEDALIDEDNIDVFVFIILEVWDTDILDVFEFIALSDDNDVLDGIDVGDIDALDDIDSLFIFVTDTCGVSELLNVLEALEDIDGDPESL